MKNHERMDVINHLIKLMRDKYGSDIISAGPYGSTARKTDQDFSDIPQCPAVDPLEDNRGLRMFGVKQSVIKSD